MQKGELLTTGQVATYCGVSLRTVINWINRGILLAHQLPGTRRDNRITRDNLVKFMRANNIPIPDELNNTETATETGTPEQPRKALVIDDDEKMAKAIGRVLRGFGCDVAMAHNGFDAGRLFAIEKPDIMTLDLQMPKLDGLELLQRIDHLGNCKVLVISGMGKSYLQKSLQLGASAALSKPFNNEELEAEINKLLGPTGN